MSAPWNHDWRPAREAREKGYHPSDSKSPSGFRRPPENCTSMTLAYFAALIAHDDQGKLAEAEMTDLLTNPEHFFHAPWPVWAVSLNRKRKES